MQKNVKNSKIEKNRHKTNLKRKANKNPRLSPVWKFSENLNKNIQNASDNKTGRIESILIFMKAQN